MKGRGMPPFIAGPAFPKLDPISGMSELERKAVRLLSAKTHG